ncbi:trypsin-like serine protease [Amycolatopsis keratiniphila]|uniref:trypsin-like serine protease n=1 Tax=Amycolatopsis keratiniphila TaxID=129921 RepID=UPI0009077E44|nr:trypsin-like serine protease [Amycolatopsis keratiniphila]OLZ50309.1 hypothetical protein BS330_29035 [Amycolatopsis keratiniphila subsp. nogabecina]
MAALATILATGLGAPPVSATAGGDDVSPMIVGGELARVAYAGIGSLQLDKNGHRNWHSCNVVRISSRFALTPSHCVDLPPAAALDRAGAKDNAALRAFRVTSPAERDGQLDPRDPSQYTIRFETINRFAGGVTTGVRSITRPEKWAWGEHDKDGKVWDIALIELDRPVWTGRPGRIAVPQETTSVRALGWGMTKPKPSQWGAPAPARLRELDAPIVPPGNCASEKIGAAELCLGVAPKGGALCVGDSGGAAIQRRGQDWAVVGLASRSLTLECVSPTIFTEIAPYRGWIITEMLKRGEWISQADLTLAG